MLNETETKEINQPKDIIYLYANIPLAVVTLLVNIWAIVIIRRKEKTGIHNLIVCDCIANIISFSHGAFRCPHTYPCKLVGCPVNFHSASLQLVSSGRSFIPAVKQGTCQSQ